MSQIIFLRVGIDRGCGGTLSPRFADGTFEYVPIPESAELIPGKGNRYTELAAKSGGTLDQFSGSSGYAHYDPEFESFTYGEPNAPKRFQLLKLNKGDYLVFYAGFKGQSVAIGTCFVIGYFQVKKIHTMPLSEDWPPPSLKHLHGNAHFKRLNRENTLVVVEGDPEKSKLLSVSKQLSDEHQMVMKQVEYVIGFGGSVKRAIGRWVPETHHNATLNWLRS